MSMLDSIKTALKKAGLREDLAEGLDAKIKSEKDIEGEIDELKKDVTNRADSDKVLDSDAFQKAIKEAGLAKSLEAYAEREADKRVTQALKSSRERAEKEAAEKKEAELKEKERLEKEKNMTEEQKTLAALREELSAVKTELGNLAQSKQQETLRVQIEQALAEKKLDKSFVSNVHVTKPEEIEAAVNELFERVTVVQQAKIDKALEDAGAPKKGKTPTGDALEGLVTEMAEAKNKGETIGAIHGKELSIDTAHKN